MEAVTPPEPDLRSRPTSPPRLLVVTNDFPPRVGGVQRYVHDLVRHLPPDRVTVLAPAWPGWREFDRTQPYPVRRYAGGYLAPVPDALRRVRSLLRESGAEMVLFGHGLPLGAMGPRVLRESGVPYALLTHGAEVWLARLPGLFRMLRHACSEATAVFAVSRYTERRVRRAVPEGVPTIVLPPGVDVERFHPGVDGAPVRVRHGLGGRPTVVCISRLVPRKGQDVLIRAWPEVRRRVPEAALLLVGDGAYRPRLESLAREANLGESVHFTGEVEEKELPAHYAAGDVFAMPCRSRYGGLEVEGFGIVFLEAAAVGKPAVAGESGGAAEAVEDGRTGLVVDGRSRQGVAAAVASLLEDRRRARAMGAEGRARVERELTWPRLVGRLQAGLTGDLGT